MVAYIVDMDTTIQVSNELLEKLKKMKMHSKESYEELIWDLIEDRMELSEETKKEMEVSRQQYKEGKFTSLEKIKKELKIK
jgi:hypothetical protein